MHRIPFILNDFSKRRSDERFWYGDNNIFSLIENILIIQIGVTFTFLSYQYQETPFVAPPNKQMFSVILRNLVIEWL